MSFGNRSFTGSLVKPLVNPSGASLPGSGPTTVLAGGESFYMDVKDAQDISIQVNVGSIGTVGSTLTVTCPGGVNTTSGLLTLATGTGWTGNLIQLTTSGSLPTGTALATNYYIYIVTGLGIQLFSSLANCLLAQALYNNSLAPASAAGLVIPSGGGTGTLTLTPTAISGFSYKLQGSNDFVPSPNLVGSGSTLQSGLSSTGAPTALNAGNWFDVASAESPAALVTNTITTASTTSRVTIGACPYAYVRVLFAGSAGTIQAQIIGHI